MSSGRADERRYPAPVLDRLANEAARPADAVIVGDSIAQYWPPTMLSAAMHGTVANLGVAEDSVADVAARVVGLGFPLHPGTVLVVAGTNRPNTGPAVVVAQIVALCRTIRARADHARILVFAVLPIGTGLSLGRDDAEAIDDGLQAASGAGRFVLVDDRAIFLSACRTTPCGLMRPDLIHPSVQGYAVMGVLLERTMQELSRHG